MVGTDAEMWRSIPEHRSATRPKNSIFPADLAKSLSPPLGWQSAGSPSGASRLSPSPRSMAPNGAPGRGPAAPTLLLAPQERDVFPMRLIHFTMKNGRRHIARMNTKPSCKFMPTPPALWKRHAPLAHRVPALGFPSSPSIAGRVLFKPAGQKGFKAGLCKLPVMGRALRSNPASRWLVVRGRGAELFPHAPNAGKFTDILTMARSHYCSRNSFSVLQFAKQSILPCSEAASTPTCASSVMARRPYRESQRLPKMASL